MSNRFWLVTKGFGRYDSTYSPVFYIKRRTGVEENIPHSAFQIPYLEVYPNPFHKNLTIKLQIPKQKGASSQKSVASIKIYDISGRLVKSFSLTTDNCVLGTIVWDGTDDSGYILPSGVYFIRLQVVDKCILKKAVKLK
uniref:T9SS type A sorting domain-containing protein n=1 Tax=candidate division WOR-3 bacterium TaxID=2052148 RepID=A0A7V3RGX4_UNCW3